MSGRVIKGVKWSAIERFSVQIVQFVVSMILARLLTPEIYGVIALSLVILNILQTINEMGFGAALMQKLDRDELDFSSIFVMNIGLGLFLYLILFFCAPLLASLFGYEELIIIIRWMGLNLIITSFVVVQRTKLMIAVDFKLIAQATFIGAVISGLVAVYCAYCGMGAMALVIQSLLNSLVSVAFIWLQVKWIPKLQFSWKRFKVLFNFAYKLILSRLVQSVYNESYSLIVGAFFSPAQLGLYNRAKSFETLSTNNITMIVQRVSTPLFCEQQKDNGVMGNTLLRFISNTALIVYPLLIGIIVLSKPLILVLLTEKWAGSIWILQVICLVGFFYVVSTFNRNVFNATGRTDWALQSEIIRKILAILIIIGAIFGGFKLLVWSQVIIAILEFFIDLYYTKRQIGLSIRRQIQAVAPILFSSSIMGGIVFIGTSLLDDDLIKLIVGFILGIISYAIICFFFNVGSIRAEIKKIL